MTISAVSHQAHGYRVSTPVYEGPLDLLLQLIEREELDITRLALAHVTDQYLAHMRELQERAAEEVSAFLVIASKLLQIKSEALLPRPPVREPGEEDPGEALAQQLIAYKRYRQIADQLSQREAKGYHAHLRLAAPPKVEGNLDLAGLGITDLIAAAFGVFFTNKFEPPLSSLVAPPRITIREKIILIAQALRNKGRITFLALLNDKPSRMDIVVTFLAMLELVKRSFVHAQQSTLFGEIQIEPTSSWDECQDFETEFGE
jgi:segregation and condensation protein A